MLSPFYRGGKCLTQTFSCGREWEEARQRVGGNWYVFAGLRSFISIYFEPLQFWLAPSSQVTEAGQGCGQGWVGNRIPLTLTQGNDVWLLEGFSGLGEQFVLAVSPWAARGQYWRTL